MEEERINTEKIEKTEKKVKIDIDRYRAKEGEKISLKKFSTNCDMDVDKEYEKTVSMTAALEELSVPGEAVCPEYIRAYYRTAGDGRGRERRHD